MSMESSVLLFMQNRKKTRNFSCSFCLSNMLMFMIQNRTKRTEKLPCSFLRQNRKEKEFFLFISLYSVSVFLITGTTKRTEKLPCSFLRQNRKEKRNFSCSFFLATPRFAFMMADSLWSDIELRDMFQDS